MVRKSPSGRVQDRFARLSQFIERTNARLRHDTAKQTDRTFYRRLNRHDSLVAMLKRLHQQRRR